MSLPNGDVESKAVADSFMQPTPPSRRALVGFSGFVGQHLLSQTDFTDLYRSTNIASIASGGAEFELLVVCGLPAAKWLANKENAADMIGGANLGSKDAQVTRVLLDLSTTAQIGDSMKVGKAVLDQIGGINRLHKGQVEQAGFAVLLSLIHI